MDSDPLVERCPAVSELITIPAGKAVLGSTAFYPEEQPLKEVHVEEFRLERHPVTNRQFAEFVAATGYVTTAEQPLPEDFRHLPEHLRGPGSLVFTGTDGPVELSRWEQWWSWVPGAHWRQPFGAGSNIAGKDDHPVVQVSFDDAQAYATWAGRRLPTEDEWEYAVTNPEAEYAWGTEFMPDGRLLANTFQGSFPYNNAGANGWRGTSPVGSFPETKHGLLDMIGNVWEWTSTVFQDRRNVKPCCTPSVAPAEASHLVVKGGSHLCHPSYCRRYRPAARQPQTPDSASTHIGFRCAL